MVSLINKLRPHQGLKITIKNIIDGSVTQVNISKINYISADNNHIQFFVEDDKVITVRNTLKLVQEELDSKCEYMLRIHRSYIVNRNKVEAVHGNFVKVAGQQLPIGRSYKKQFLELLDPKN